jgi:UDP-N-acetyl-2-amino-2-deoxyglucuronate dehydrogenase
MWWNDAEKSDNVPSAGTSKKPLVRGVAVLKFGFVGVAGYVAPRHLAAVQAVGGTVAVAHDITDSARILDKTFPEAVFFTELDRMERHLARQCLNGGVLDYFSVCSPNHLHDAHIRFALRNGADAICEKPVVINPWNLDLLREAEGASGRRVWTILQLRYLPSLIALRDRIAAAPENQRFDVDLSYITARGNWYFTSWKGDEELSGGIATNIGIHFFDLLQWVFGPVDDIAVHVRRPEVVGGTLSLARADVRWLLSVNEEHLPGHVRADGVQTFRSIAVDGDELDFTNYGTDLHVESYRHIVAGDGFGLADAAPSVELTHRVRTTPLSVPTEDVHPLVPGLLP